MMHRIIITVGAIIGLVALTAGCSGGPVEEYRTVTVSGAVKMIAGPMPAGTLHFRLYNLWYLDGEMRHSLEEIEDFQSQSGNFSHTFEYPLHKGTGLAVHVWLDADADGLFCSPASRVDPAGLIALEDTPEKDVSVAITLTDNCRAANFFYPPAAQ